MTKKQLLKLRLEFRFGHYTMVEWFEITQGPEIHCRINSGLRNADGETKSPYHYDETIIGKNSEKLALQKFNDWFVSLKI